MNKMIIFLSILGAFVVTGCKSIEVEKRGQTLAYDESGAVVRTAAGDPLVLDQGWTVDYFQHWNTQKFDSLSARAGEASLDINNYASQADSNLVALIDTSLTGVTTLSTKLAAAIATSGGSVVGEAAVKLAADVAERFKAAGGDETKATVTTTPNGIVVVSDGKTTTTAPTVAGTVHNGE